jgi:hypothetical protein
MHQLFIDFKKAYDLVKTQVLYTLLEFCVPKKLIRLIKMCLNETYSKVFVGKQSDTFPIQNGLKQEDALSPLLFNFALQLGTITYFNVKTTKNCENENNSKGM